MEEELGFALFNRGKNGVSMNSYGASQMCIRDRARNVYRDDCRFVVGGTGREPERAKAGYLQSAHVPAALLRPPQSVPAEFAEMCIRDRVAVGVAESDRHSQRIGGIGRLWHGGQMQQHTGHLLHLLFHGLAVTGNSLLDLHDVYKRQAPGSRL